MIKLLLDQGLPRSAASHLASSGIDAVHLGDLGASTLSDTAILELARSQGRTVVTLDADFHALLAASRARSPSVIRIRIEGLRGGELADLLLVVLQKCDSDLVEGVAVTVQPHRLRLRRLPLVS